MRTSSRPLLTSCKMLWVVLLLTGACVDRLNAQPAINFTSLTTKNGLSSNTVNDIVKDRYGLMWFATEDGLNKFDGTTFTVYRAKTDDHRSLAANEILCLHEDKAGNLWIGTSGGSLSMYDRQHDAFINYPAGKKAGNISHNVIRDITSDHQGRIWVGSFTGVDILDPATQKITPLNGENGKRFSNVCIALLEDRQQNIWIGTPEGLFQYNPVTKKYKKFVNDPTDTSSLSGNIIAAITQDSDGHIWIGTQQGLSLLKADGTGFVNYHHNEKDGTTISNGAVRCIATDNERNLWIGTERGVNIMNTKNHSFHQIFYDYRNVHGLTSEGIRSVYMDNKGICWLGTTRGGIDKYDNNLNLFDLITSNPFDPTGLNAPIVTSFAEQADGTVFVGTEGGGLSLFYPATKQFKHLPLLSKRKGADNRIIVRSLKITSQGQLLIGTFSDGLFCMNPVNGSYRQLMEGNNAGDLNTNDIYCVTITRDGNWWIGTNGGGINVMNPNGVVIRRYTPAPKYRKDIKLPINGFIRDILQDSAGNMWIATHGGGMASFDPTTNHFTIFNTMNSRMQIDKVQTLLQDRHHNIWAGTFGGGLSMVEKSSGQLVTFTEKDGLQNNTIYKIVEDNKGLLWLSSNKGISSIEPGSKKISNYNYYNGIQRNNFFQGAGYKTMNGTIFFGGLEGFNYFNPQYLKKNSNVPEVLITDLKISNQSVSPSKGGVIEQNVSVAKVINLDFRQNFALNYVGLNYTAPGQNQYAYKLEGFDKDWNYVGSTTIAHYTNLDPGTYTFRVKASNNDGVWSAGKTSIKIVVHPPIWRTAYAYILYVLLLITTVLYLRHKSIEKIKRRFAAEQEHKEAARVHEIDQLKIKFLTNLSHEFRTPISLILGPVDKILSEEENIRWGDHLQMIKRNGKRLLNLVNQLLDFRKMEEHELKLQSSDGELVGFVKDVFDSFKDLAERKKILFTYNTNTAQLPACFDHDKIERILFNLLSNSFKFTPEGGHITLELEKQETENADQNVNLVTIRVTDSGIGIPADKKHKIFDRFFQHNNAASVLNQGSGIGLSITREFVSMHGGTIAVESELDKGSCFTVQLPMLCIKEQPAPGHSDNNALTNAKHESKTDGNMAVTGKKLSALTAILLVEDNDDFRFYLKENLRQYYKVYEAANGKEGWQKALAHHPQLIVSDISMPYMDGIELCKKLKADKRTNHIPVILLTALTGEKDQLKGLQTGANDYITKPFNFELLNSKIKNLLLLKDTFKTTYSRTIDVKLPVTEGQPADEKLLSNLLLYLEENMTETQISVEKVSRYLGMSRSKLYSKLFELTGQTPVEYIRSVKLDKAAALLQNSDMNISEIAYSVGFATPNYFAKTFKEKFNMLPSEFIQKTRKTPAQKIQKDA